MKASSSTAIVPLPLPLTNGRGRVWTSDPEGNRKQVAVQVESTGWLVSPIVAMSEPTKLPDFTMGLKYGPVQLSCGWDVGGEGTVLLTSFCCNQSLNLSNDAPVFQCSRCRYNLPVGFTRRGWGWFSAKGLMEETVELVEAWLAYTVPNPLEAALIAGSLNAHLMEAVGATL